MEQSTGQSHLPEVQIPLDVNYLWEWFLDLHGSRQSGFGVSPITYLEIKAWSDLRRILPSPWEVGTLRRMDQKVITTVDRLSKQRANASKGKVSKVM